MRSFCIICVHTGNKERKTCIDYRASFPRMRSQPDFCDLPEKSVSHWMLNTVLLLRVCHVVQGNSSGRRPIYYEVSVRKV